MRNATLSSLHGTGNRCAPATTSFRITSDGRNGLPHEPGEVSPELYANAKQTRASMASVKQTRQRVTSAR